MKMQFESGEGKKYSGAVNFIFGNGIYVDADVYVDIEEEEEEEE